MPADRRFADVSLVSVVGAITERFIALVVPFCLYGIDLFLSSKAFSLRVSCLFCTK